MKKLHLIKPWQVGPVRFTLCDGRTIAETVRDTDAPFAHCAAPGGHLVLISSPETCEYLAGPRCAPLDSAHLSAVTKRKDYPK